MPRVYGPFPILRKISDNTYQLDLQGKYEISSSFNVSDLSPFLADNPDLLKTPFEEEGNDAPQYIEPNHDEDQTVQINPTEVFHWTVLIVPPHPFMPSEPTALFIVWTRVRPEWSLGQSHVLHQKKTFRLLSRFIPTSCVQSGKDQYMRGTISTGRRTF